VAIDGRGEVTEAGKVEQEGRKGGEGKLKKGATHGGESYQNPTGTGEHGHAGHCGLERDAEVAGRDGMHVEDAEAAEPVEAGESTDRGAAEAAAAVEEAGVLGGVTGHIDRV